MYKVGDKVVVRRDFSTKLDMPSGIEEEMVEIVKDKSYVLTISKVGEDGTGYEVEEDNGDWSWDEEMFVGVLPTIKVGDKIKLRPELTKYDTAIDNINSIKNQVLTVSEVRHKGNGRYGIDVLENCWAYRDSWIMLVEENDEKEDTKFRAFLEEVVRGTHSRAKGKYYPQWSKVYDILKPTERDMTKEQVDERINELVEFYKTFTPMYPKKMTKEQIEKALGYEIEII